MLVFIDELGDAGLDVAGGASPIFVAAMVVFIHDAAAAATQRAIDDRDARRLPRREFKFSKCRDEVRDRFFDAVRGCDFNVRRDRRAEGQDAFAGAAGGAELILRILRRVADAPQRRRPRGRQGDNRRVGLEELPPEKPRRRSRVCSEKAWSAMRSSRSRKCRVPRRRA